MRPRASHSITGAVTFPIIKHHGIFSMVDMARVWPILCQFGIGGLLCSIGVWAGLSSGYLDMKLRDDRRLIWVFIGGFLGLLLLSCAFTFWLPFVGEGPTS